MLVARFVRRAQKYFSARKYARPSSSAGGRRERAHGEGVAMLSATSRAVHGMRRHRAIYHAAKIRHRRALARGPVIVAMAAPASINACAAPPAIWPSNRRRSNIIGISAAHASAWRGGDLGARL